MEIHHGDSYTLTEEDVGCMIEQNPAHAPDCKFLEPLPEC